VTAYALLLLAIGVEVVATALMPRTEGFRNLPWVALVLGCYAFAFFLMSRVVETLPVYVVYAAWAGMGTALVAVVGIVVLHEPTSAIRIAGIVLVVIGVVLVNWAVPHE
jgi:multidrug transporter EmrE-like cation transporter